MRIAHLTPTYFGADSVVGGGERYVANVAKAIRHTAAIKGYPVEQAIISIGKSDQLFLQDGIVVRLLKNESASPSLMECYSQFLWDEIADFDLIHVHQSLTTFGAYASVLTRSSHRALVMTDLGGGHHPVMVGGRGLDLADGVISISNFAHSLIASSYSGLSLIAVGPIDVDTFRPNQPWDKDRKSIICVSRIMPHKGIDRIVRALPPGLSLTIVGNVYHDPYYALLKELANGKDVAFVHDASDEELVELYRQAGAFAQGSTSKDVYGTVVRKTELMGLTTLEAMSCGLPVIVSDGGSLPELVPNETIGRVFHNDDELAAQLIEFRDGVWPNDFSAEAAHQHVADHHSDLAIGERFIRFYRSVLDGHRS